jgi:hypothetical protein
MIDRETFAARAFFHLLCEVQAIRSFPSSALKIGRYEVCERSFDCLVKKERRTNVLRG